MMSQRRKGGNRNVGPCTSAQAFDVISPSSIWRKLPQSVLLTPMTAILFFDPSMSNLR
jgi:hypothetical protein